MSIANLADRYLGFTGGTNLSRAGLNCRRITQEVGNPASSSSLIATIFWQAFMFSPAYSKTLQGVTGITSRAFNEGQKLVVRHGVERLPRHDLIIIDPGFNQSEPSAIRTVNTPSVELREGWNAFIDNIAHPPRSSVERAIFTYGQEAVIEASQEQQFGLMVSAPLPREYTSLLPTPALGVAHRIEPSICTVGVIAKDAKGREGVTTALHSLETNNNHVFIDGIQSVIDPHDMNIITDSCFIEVPGITTAQAQKLSGPLRGVIPSGPVSFQRANDSNPIFTQVIAWDADIPFAVAAWKRFEVWTDPITERSDSGTALIDDNNFVVGFAYCIAGKEDSGYSAWIWAESVFDAHMLQ